MPTNAKIPIVFLDSLFRWKYDIFVAQGIAIVEGYFFNEPTKSSLTGKKIAQSGHPGFDWGNAAGGVNYAKKVLWNWHLWPISWNFFVS